jgi:hypothetical protein
MYNYEAKYHFYFIFIRYILILSCPDNASDYAEPSS